MSIQRSTFVVKKDPVKGYLVDERDTAPDSVDRREKKLVIA